MTTRHHCPQRAPPSDALTSDPPCSQICARSLFLLWSSVDPPGIFCHHCWYVMKGDHIQIMMLKVKQWETWILYFTQLSDHICFALSVWLNRHNVVVVIVAIIQSANKRVLGILSGKHVSSSFLSAFTFVCWTCIYMLTLVKMLLNILWYGVPGSATKYKNDTADNKTQAPGTYFNCSAPCLWHSHFSIIFQDYSGLKRKHAHASINCIWLYIYIYILCTVYMFVIYFWDWISKVQIWIEVFNKWKGPQQETLCVWYCSVF